MIKPTKYRLTKGIREIKTVQGWGEFDQSTLQCMSENNHNETPLYN
jgi:hypothetical protein